VLEGLCDCCTEKLVAEEKEEALVPQHLFLAPADN